MEVNVTQYGVSSWLKPVALLRLCPVSHSWSCTYVCEMKSTTPWPWLESAPFSRRYTTGPALYGVASTEYEKEVRRRSTKTGLLHLPPANLCTSLSSSSTMQRLAPCRGVSSPRRIQSPMRRNAAVPRPDGRATHLALRFCHGNEAMVYGASHPSSMIPPLHLLHLLLLVLPPVVRSFSATQFFCLVLSFQLFFPLFAHRAVRPLHRPSFESSTFHRPSAFPRSISHAPSKKTRLKFHTAGKKEEKGGRQRRGRKPLIGRWPRQEQAVLQDARNANGKTYGVPR